MAKQGQMDERKGKLSKSYHWLKMTYLVYMWDLFCLYTCCRCYRRNFSTGGEAGPSNLLDFFQQNVVCSVN